MKLKNENIQQKVQQIKAILFDVDGVLTDGGIIYDDTGGEVKKFNVKDGQIVSPLRQSGFIIGAITGRLSPIVKRRCEELRLDFHKHGVSDKLIEYNNFKQEFNLLDDNIAYIGDDIIDLSILVRCGLAIAPADSRDYIQENVDIVTASKGGDGVFRDVADYILHQQGKLSLIIKNLKGNHNDNESII